MKGRGIGRGLQGQALVEFVLFLTFLLMLIGGVLDIGRALAYYTVLNDAVQEGAAYGAVFPHDTRGIQERALESAGNFLDPEEVFLEIHFVGRDCAGGGIEVRATVEVHMLFPLTAMLVPGDSIPITAATTQTIVRPPCP